MKKGQIVCIKLRDHSLLPRGCEKDNKIVLLNVVGRVHSTRGRQVILETWWADDKELIQSHEWAKILKSDIVKWELLTRS
jgi:hypothetical protein